MQPLLAQTLGQRLPSAARDCRAARSCAAVGCRRRSRRPCRRCRAAAPRPDRRRSAAGRPNVRRWGRRPWVDRGCRASRSGRYRRQRLPGFWRGEDLSGDGSVGLLQLLGEGGEFVLGLTQLRQQLLAAFASVRAWVLERRRFLGGACRGGRCGRRVASVCVRSAAGRRSRAVRSSQVPRARLSSKRCQASLGLAVAGQDGGERGRGERSLVMVARSSPVAAMWRRALAKDSAAAAARMALRLAVLALSVQVGRHVVVAYGPCRGVPRPAPCGGWPTPCGSPPPPPRTCPERSGCPPGCCSLWPCGGVPRPAPCGGWPTPCGSPPPPRGTCPERSG